MTYGVQQQTCVHCGGSAVVSGTCASCGRRQVSREQRASRRRVREKQAACAHRDWTDGPVTYGSGGEGQRTDHCSACNMPRVMEVER